MSIEDIKRKVESNIDSSSEDMISIAKNILDMPEPGYREFKTSKYTKEQFGKYGFSNIEEVSMTGLKAVIDTGKPGPTVCVMGELDSLVVLGHPHADSDTNAAHACGHHCQIAQMIAVGNSLNDPEVLKGLSGKIVLIAVPAEENIEVEYRKTLRDEGKIEFLLGKQEFVKLGALDDVDIAMMTHTGGSQKDNNNKTLVLGGSSTGSVSKSIKFIGKASHAGGAPHNGINALNAANLAMTGIHFQRETFQEKDVIRIHPIITRGGAAVSSVPADVRMETYVRGSTIEGFLDASKKVDRALRAGAMAIGASVEITTLPGYLPINNDSNLIDYYKTNAKNLVGDNKVSQAGHSGGSTDMGDISQLMPTIHPYVNSAEGDGHGIDYVVTDYNAAVMTAAKAMALTVVDLLHGNGEKGKEVVDKFEPMLTKDAYLKLLRSMYKQETFEGHSS
jgi:amidohydrolase